MPPGGLADVVGGGLSGQERAQARDPKIDCFNWLFDVLVWCVGSWSCSHAFFNGLSWRVGSGGAHCVGHFVADCEADFAADFAADARSIAKRIARLIAPALGRYRPATAIMQPRRLDQWV